MSATVIIDDFSPTGSWARHLRDTAPMRAQRQCDRCGVSDWHPEAKSCTHTDCPLREARAA